MLLLSIEKSLLYCKTTCIGLKHLGSCKDNFSRDCNGTRTHNCLVRKRTLNHLAKLVILAKWLSVRLGTKLLWVRVLLQSLNLQMSRLFRALSSLTSRQL